MFHGGGQERGLRAGTLNVPGIVGFGRAAELCLEALPHEAQAIAALRDRLMEGLRRRHPDVHVNGSMAHRLPGNLNVAFPRADPDTLRLAIDDVAVSFGAACSTGSTSASHVLTALAVSEQLAVTSVRFGVGRMTTEGEIDYAIDKVSRVVDSAVKAQV
jgi:cysteine desulfurase